MSVPDFQSFMLPVLKIMGDGEEHIVSEVAETVANIFNLSEADRKEPLPSGRKTRLHDRVNWSQTYMMNAKLLERTERGKYRITERGLEVLKNNPPTISTKFLVQYPEFVAFQNASRQTTKPTKETEGSESETPEEILETSYQSLRSNLAQEILERVKKCSPRFFESLVVDLLVAMGYGGSRKDAGQAVGQSGDGGIDGIIKEDKLGLDAVYIQAKRWDNTTVGRPELQKFVGSLAGRKARKGVFITTSQFSDEARKYVDGLEMKIVLIDGEELTQLMIDHGIGVTELATYIVKKIDSDYFGED